MCESCASCNNANFLMMALPHHVELISSASPSSITYPTMMGKAQGTIILLLLLLFIVQKVFTKSCSFSIVFKKDILEINGY